MTERLKQSIREARKQTELLRETERPSDCQEGDCESVRVREIVT